MVLNLEQVEGVPVSGFNVKQVLTTEGKKEEDLGKIKIVLEANKDEVACGAYTLGDIIAGLSVHQEGKHPVTIKVLLPTNVRPNPTHNPVVPGA